MRLRRWSGVGGIVGGIWEREGARWGWVGPLDRLKWAGFPDGARVLQILPEGPMEDFYDSKSLAASVKGGGERESSAGQTPSSTPAFPITQPMIMMVPMDRKSPPSPSNVGPLPLPIDCSSDAGQHARRSSCGLSSVQTICTPFNLLVFQGMVNGGNGTMPFGMMPFQFPVPSFLFLFAGV